MRGWKSKEMDVDQGGEEGNGDKNRKSGGVMGLAKRSCIPLKNGVAGTIPSYIFLLDSRSRASKLKV